MASVGSYALCQTACNGVAVACYSGAGVPAAVVGCNTALGTCMSACHANFFVEAGAEAAATGFLSLPVLAFGGLAVAILSGGSEDKKTSSYPSKRSCDSSESSAVEHCSF